MEKRNLDDLWSYAGFGKKLKAYYKLDYRCHMRYRSQRDTRCLVYVVKRSNPGDGFEVGNFAIDYDTLQWTIDQQGNGRDRGLVDQTYVALVEDYGGRIITWDTAMNVKSLLRNVMPFYNDRGGTYYWVNEDFEPFEGSTVGPILNDPDNPPF